MNIYVAVTLFILVIIVYLAISELFAILYRFTGLPAERARFQVTSLLTGCGYTTKESEMLLSSKSRRRLTRVTMLFGYVFNITIVTSLINVFLSLKQSQVENLLLGVLVPIVILFGILIVVHIPQVHSKLENILERIAGRVMHAGSSNLMSIVDYIGQDTIAQITLFTVPEALRGVPLSESGLSTDKGLLVMLVEKPGGKPAPAKASTVFETNDKLTVFGRVDMICRVFDAKETFTAPEDEL